MPDVELARRDGVELIRTGTWGASTGSWTPTKKDILAAVDAMKCPAVGKPILTIGHVDKRFTPRASGHDGEPGIGWVDNLRAGEDGELLLGDYVGVPAWIDQIMASAWPKRSIEGKYNYRCALNHRHDFALDAVSLLGTTSPAIPTLRSLNDVAELYGVEIAASENHSGDSVYAVVVASAEVHTGAMIALIPTVEDAERLAVEGGEPADQLHLTLAFLGEATDLGARGKQDVIDHVSTVANGLPRLDAELFSVNVFNPGDAQPERDTCLVWGVTGDIIDAVHDLVAETLHLIDAPIPSQHSPWAAHITGAYTDDLGRVADLAAKVGPVSFDRLRLAFGGEFIDIPLMEWPGENTEASDDEAVAAASGDADSLHDYWTKGAGLAKWQGKPHPWAALFRELRKHLSADKAKRTASKWFREVTGHTPNEKVAASVRQFNEAKIKRDGDGQSADKAGSDRASAGPAGMAKAGPGRDKLKLGSQIKLDAGESLVSSAKVRGGDATGTNTLLAVVSTPDGLTMRVRIDDPDGEKSWDGVSGDTVTLDEDGIGRLWDDLSTIQVDIEKRSAEYKAAVADHKAKAEAMYAKANDFIAGLGRDERNRAAIDRYDKMESAAREFDERETPNPEFEGPEVVINGADGSAVVYRLYASETTGSVPDLSGGTYSAQQWDVAVAVRPPSAPDSWSFEAQIGNEAHTSWGLAQLRDLARTFDRLTVGEEERQSIKAGLELRRQQALLRRVVAAAPEFADVIAALGPPPVVPVLKVLAGRHSVPDFEETKHKRAGDGKFATKWNGGALKQDQRLGSRIKLGPGESLAGSAALRDAGIAVAAIDSDEGRKLRVGLNIPDNDISNWSGADRGRTAVLDEAGVGQLRSAITRMQDGAKRGKELLKVFEKRETDLQRQEDQLLNKQYPNLTKAQGKELGGVTRQLKLEQNSLDVYRGRQQERLANIPDADARAEAEAIEAEVSAARESGDRAAQDAAVKRMQAHLKQHGERTDTTAMMYGQTSAQIDDRHAEVARLETRRKELTGDPVRLSAADQAELDQVRLDQARHDDMWGEFNDGSSLASGTVTGEWGDIRWETTMNSDVAFHSLAVIPKGAGPDFLNDLSPESVDDADLRKLAALLDKAGADPGVRAAAPTDSTIPAEPPAPILPAAEPEPINIKEDPVSLSEDMRSRLGLAADADETAAIAAIDDLKARADKQPEPTPEMVAASSAATEKATKAVEAQELMKEEMTRLSGELATIKASAAATVKASTFSAWKTNGQLKPADEETWSARYDRDPEMVTDIINARAAGSEVPVMASGVTGPAEPVAASSNGTTLSDADFNRVFGITETQGA